MARKIAAWREGMAFRYHMYVTYMLHMSESESLTVTCSTCLHFFFSNIADFEPTCPLLCTCMPRDSTVHKLNGKYAVNPCQ
mmetsp:Transcript_16849/g.50487  ORF Transcript_16849/g.50487 Transcript_16849/m.50487 type:complete len:81 (+) Transcript_16849:690-932(+)